MNKHLFFTFLMVLFVSSCKAVKLSYGSLDLLRHEKNIRVVLDLSKTTYRKKYPLNDFIQESYRIDNWEIESIRAFVSRFNTKTKTCSLKAVLPNQDIKINFEMQIAPKNITKKGRFENTIVSIVEVSTKKVVASFVVNISDGDADDNITFRDPMLEGGEKIGRFINSQLK